MKDALILEHKTYISAKRASEITGYTSDYVGQLCRAGKIVSKMVGRGWFVLEESLLQHKLINDDVKTNKKTARRRRALQLQNPSILLTSKTQVSSNNSGLDQNKNASEQNKSDASFSIFFPAVLLLTERAESIELALKASRVVPVMTVATTTYTEKTSEPIKTPYAELQKEVQEMTKEINKANKDSFPVRFVPSHFSVRGVSLVLALDNGKINFSTRKNSYLNILSLKNLDGNPLENFVAMVLVVFAIAGSGLFVESSLVSLAHNGAPTTPSSQLASVASVSGDILSSMMRGFQNISNKVAMYFGFEHVQVATNATPGSSEIFSSPGEQQNVSNKDLGFNGIAVAQSTNSPEKDELIKQKIRDSFSDEVTVHPDSTGTSGVITPVFKKATGDNFVYVLVPIPDTKQ